jgi:hypothetical protein
MAKKTEVTFVNTSTEVKKTLLGLSKTALRASGKVVRKYLRENIPVRSKRFKNHIGSWVMVDYNTGQPQLQIGFYSWQKVRKKGKLPSHVAPWWVEFGTKIHMIQPKRAKILAHDDIIYGHSVSHPGTHETHVLRDTVQNHITDIRAAQEEYLAEISKTLEEAGIKIDQGEEFEDDD